MQKPRISQPLTSWPKPLTSMWSLSPPIYTYPSATPLFISNFSHFLSQENMRTQVGERFSDFFQKWVTQLESDLDLLLRATRDNKESECEALVARLTAHHKDYYKAKWALAHEDVMAFFNPAWLSPLEQAYQWVTGWKPSSAFRLLDSLRRSAVGSLAGMTEEQVRKVADLKGKIKSEEERVEREMERQQVAMADRQMVELAQLASRVKSGSGAAPVDMVMESAMKSMMDGLERVMKMADCVRLKTLKGLLEALNPVQCVELLAGLGMVQVQMRSWGKRREMMRGPVTMAFI